MTILDRVLKSRDITLPTKVCIVIATVFPVNLYGCERWTIKKTECQRIAALELWCWRRLLGVPWTARRSKPVNSKGNQPWIFTGKTDAEAEAPILWPPDLKSQLIGKDPDAGKDWRRRRGKQRMRCWMASPTQWRWLWANCGRIPWTEEPGGLQSMDRKGSDMTEQLNHNWPDIWVLWSSQVDK